MQEYTFVDTLMSSSCTLSTVDFFRDYTVMGPNIVTQTKVGNLSLGASEIDVQEMRVRRQRYPPEYPPAESEYSGGLSPNAQVAMWNIFDFIG